MAQSHQEPAVNKVHYSLYRDKIIEMHLRNYLFVCLIILVLNEICQLSRKLSYEDHQLILE